MTITFRCEHCGKKVEAPDSVGGKRGKCPYCKQSNYIPSPVKDDELIGLAPEDEDERQRTQVEMEAIRDQHKNLIAELGSSDASSAPLERREDLKPEDLYHLVVNYCLDLADSKLEQAEVHLGEMRKFRRTAATAVDDFLNGKAIEPALDRIPTKVLQGFLNQLRSALK